MPYSNRNKLDALNETAEELVGELNRINADTGQQLESVSKRQRRNTRINILVGISLLISFVMLGIMFFNLDQTSDNTKKVDKITQRLDYSQKVTRQKVLCPLYQIFVDSKSEQARKVYARGPEEYDRIFRIIQESYDTIKCAEFKAKGNPKG